MNNEECVSNLKLLFSENDWFSKVGLDEYNRPTLYVKYMCDEILLNIPIKMGDKHVLVHFEKNLLSDASQYIEKANFRQLTATPKSTESVRVVLEKLLANTEINCDIDIISDIFYEVVDQDDAVTNHSESFPIVRKEMAVLFSVYGYDVIEKEICFLGDQIKKTSILSQEINKLILISESLHTFVDIVYLLSLDRTNKDMSLFDQKVLSSYDDDYPGVISGVLSLFKEYGIDAVNKNINNRNI